MDESSIVKFSAEDGGAALAQSSPTPILRCCGRAFSVSRTHTFLHDVTCLKHVLNSHL